MIGSLIWYNVGGGYKTIGIVTDHRKDITQEASSWIRDQKPISNAVKIFWIKESGPKPRPLNYYSPVPDLLESELYIAYPTDARRWYDLSYFKIISEMK